MFGIKKFLHIDGEEKEISNLSWEADVVLNARRSRLIAWRVASVAIALVVLMVISLMLLLPLKQVVPYVVTVDRLTGESSITSSAKDYVSTSTLNDKHWIKTFLIARERYSFQLLQHDYDTVKSLAGDPVWKSYAAMYEGASARDAVLADKTEIIPTVLSITLNANGTATARYELRTRDFRSTAGPVLTRHVATIRYSYQTQIGKREFEMIDNPLGFTVNGYQSDPEFMNSSADNGAAK
jgi:type IV secretion system protein VirB8